MDAFLVENMKIINLEAARKEKQVKQEKDLTEYESSEMYKLYEYYAEYECGECDYLVMPFFKYCPNCGIEFE